MAGIRKGHALRIVVEITALVLLLAGGAGAATPISSCTMISSPGTYVLTQSIIHSPASTCIDITSSNVIFDGAGYTIDGVIATGAYGVYVYSYTTGLTNVTVKNLLVMDWNFGIIFFNTQNGSITNNTASNNSYGIGLSGSSNNTIYNNYFNNTNNFGISGTGSNTWNTTKTSGTNIIGGSYLGGNVWANPSGTGFSQTCADSNSDGICDSSYTLDSINIDYQSLASKPAITPSPTPTPTPTPTVTPTPTPIPSGLSGAVVNFGQLITGKSNIWALTTGIDGKIYGGTGEGGTLFVYDPNTSMSENIKEVLGEDAVYSLITDEKGLIYSGTAWNSKLFVYNPLNKSITYLGQPVTDGGIICSLAVIGSDIYGSTSDGGDSSYTGSHLFVYNSTTRIFIDLGQPVAGERGSKISAGKDGKVYGGTSPNGYLFAYNPSSGAFTVINQSVQSGGTAFPIITGKDGKIYFQLDGSLLVFDPLNSRIDKLFELRGFIPVSGEFFWSLVVDLDGNIYGGTAPSGYLVRYNRSDGAISFGRPIASETRIRALTAGIDNKIYGGTAWNAYLFSYTPTPPTGGGGGGGEAIRRLLPLQHQRRELQQA